MKGENISKDNMQMLMKFCLFSAFRYMHYNHALSPEKLYSL